MYLKELTLRGFKSFGNPTTLRFRPGITAVVGPNGSGKSNLVDALAWVMGEQGARALRGTSMQDVIFSGTATRPSLGRAQVSLTIDNSDHALDIDYTEVTITRTIYRAGGSDYSINGSPVRLLDVQDLLSDAGLGSQMHVIVGQGQLSRILSSDPQGHRAIIDEAAGILKHRKRKERSLRRLASTRQNLGRLADLIAEIDKQMRPLDRQAKTARRADQLQAELRASRGRLLAADLADARDRRKGTEGNLASVRAELRGKSGELARTKIAISDLENSDGSADPGIARLSDAIGNLRQIDQRLVSLTDLAAERLRQASQEQGQLTARHVSDPDLLDKRARETATEAARQEGTVQSASAALEEVTEKRANLEARLASLRKTIAELRRSEKEHAGAITRFLQLIAGQKAVVQSAAQRVSDLSPQRNSVSQSLERLRSSIADADEDGQEERTEEGLREKLPDCEERLRQASSRLSDLRGRRGELEATRIRLEARADALDDTLHARHATDVPDPSVDPRDAPRAHSPRQEARQDPVGSVTPATPPVSSTPLGPLADFVRVAPGWENALSAALWTFADATVLPGREALEGRLERADSHRQARQSYLVPLEEGGPGDADVPDADVHRLSRALWSEDSDARAQDSAGAAPSVPRRAAFPGVIPAIMLVRVRSAGEPSDVSRRLVSSLRTLLAGIGICEGRKMAFAAMADSGNGWRAVITRAGDVVTAAGAVTAGSGTPGDFALVARRDHARSEVRKTADSLDALDSQIKTAAATADSISAERTDLLRRRDTARIEREKRQERLRLLRQQEKDLAGRLSRLDDALSQARTQQDQASARVEELERSLEKARNEGSGDVSLDDFESRETAAESDLAAARENEMHARESKRTAHDRLDSLNRQVETLREQATAARHETERVTARTRVLARRIDRLHRLEGDADALRVMVGVWIEDRTRRREEAARKASQHETQLKELRARRDAQEPEVGRLQSREHDLDLERERLLTRLGELSQKAQDTLGMDPDEVLTQYGPSVGADGAKGSPVPFDRQAELDHAAKLQSSLRHLGRVNPLAAEEFGALQERRQYLAQQRDDVEKSCEDLTTLVSGLDSTMRSVFKSAFDDIERAFERIFAQLFPGGKGRLRLEDPQHLLTTGVIVEASPAGKRVRELSLLSGGEKSLTALALLLAIFEARPSPFYVMDEVEAALDDINLTRLLRVLRGLKDHAQLIIITHQQRTMSIADMLYGVSMRADGVSAVMAQSMESLPAGAHGRLKTPQHEGGDQNVHG